MKKTTKTCLIVAVCLLVVGIVVSIVGLAMLGFDLTKLNTRDMETNTHLPEGQFSRVRVQTYTSNIHILPSEDGSCKVVCYEDAKMKHTVQVKDGVLEIRQTDEREWYEYIGINLAGEIVTVYLPESSYEHLRIETATGNVEASETVTFQNAELQTSTGNVQWEARVSGKLDVQTATGNVKVVGVSCTDLRAKVSTGNVYITGTVAAEKMSVETATGNVVFEKADAGEIQVKTGTGNVKGTLLTEKVFLTETSTGDIHVPNTTSGGRCQISTSTGDIKLEIDKF